MKIGLVCPYNYVRGGGVQECVRAMHDRLKKMGHEVRVITPLPLGYNGHTPVDTIFLGSSTDFHSPLATTTQLSASVNDQEIEEMLAREQFDILHFHEPWVPMLSQQILKRSNAVHVATFHAKLPESVMARTMAKVVTPYTKGILNYIDEFTAVSGAAAEYVRTLSDEPITFIPNGINLHHYKPATRAAKALAVKEHGKKTIFYVGRLEKRKGVKHLLKAYALLAKEHHDVRLVIGGDGPDRAKLEQYVEDANIPDVTFAGFLSEAEKLHYLQTSDLFCSPALYGESFGIVLLEAMATGLVTVAGDNSGYTSVLKELGSISVVDPEHTEDFMKRLELLLYEKTLRELWKAWAKTYVKQFDYDIVVTQYETVYKKALKKHGKKQ